VRAVVACIGRDRARADLAGLGEGLFQPPPHFEEIAVLNASSKSMFNAGGQRTTDKVGRAS